MGNMEAITGLIEYVAFLEPDGEDGGYAVVFPDLPGCVSAGSNFAHAVDMAHDALWLHTKSMIADGEPLPRMRSVEDIRRAAPPPDTVPEHEVDVHRATPQIIRVAVPRGRAKRVDITLDEGLVDAIDGAARRLDVSRSAFIASACQDYLRGVRP